MYVRGKGPLVAFGLSDDAVGEKGTRSERGGSVNGCGAGNASSARSQEANSVGWGGCFALVSCVVHGLICTF